MNLSALLTSASLNTVICLVLFSLYSVLRKQPTFISVYFGQKLALAQSKRNDPFWIGRLIPSASWIKKAWETSEDELYAIGGVDAVVFLRGVVFSIRIFIVASIICLFLVLPLNYFGKEMEHKQIRDEPLSVFTIGNVQEGSRWLWAHCLALYIITLCACCLLHFEYMSITKMRLSHITASLYYPSHFTVIVRAIPWAPDESYSDSVMKFFTEYYASSYLSHQMFYHSGVVQKIMSDAQKMYKILKSTNMDKQCVPKLMRCGFCGVSSASFKMLADEPNSSCTAEETMCLDTTDMRKQECDAALVFFRTRYAALVASEALQSPNPMLWVTDTAPEPHDIFWPNLCLPYRILWIRRILVMVASFFFVVFFLFPVVFTQSLVHFDKLKKMFPFLKNIGERKVLVQLITGYLPSVIFLMFLYMVAPLMYLFSTLEGAVSRSGRKISTCMKVLYFVIWNVFFVNILTEAAIDHYQVSMLKLGDAKNIPQLLARAIPATASYFITYVLTSGWTSLALELIQPFTLVCNLFYRYILRNKDDASYGTYTFPYHTEIPRVLLFGLLGFTCATLAPLILPFLLVYFCIAFLVYRNQIINVYVTEYDSGGLYWPIIHNTTIFSLVLTQIVALGVFGIKESPIASGFTFPLIIITLLFHEFCRQRFQPVFSKTPAKLIVEMDREDEHCGRMDEIHMKLLNAYCDCSQGTTSSVKPAESVTIKTEVVLTGTPVSDSSSNDLHHPASL